MPDRSDESLEEELGMLDEEPSDSDGSSDDVDLADLEAELGTGGADDEASGDVGLEQDPSDQYADLLGDAPAASGGTGEGGRSPTAERGRSSSDGGDDGGFLSGLFGGSDSSAEDSAADPGGSPSVGTGAADLDEPTTAVDAESILDDVDAGPSTGVGSASAGESQSTGSRRARLAGFFSPRAFLAAVLAVAVLGGVGRTFVPIVGGPAGIAAGAFLVGLVSGERRYLEVAVAGALVGALGAFAGGLSVAFAAGATRRLLAAGAAGGLVLSLIGAYFGNDLRAGLVGGGEDWSEEEL